MPDPPRRSREASADASDERTGSSSSRRLAGAVSLREIEDGERRRRHRHQRNREHQRKLRLGIAGGVLLIAAVVGLVWRDLNRKHFTASEPLKYLGLQYELEQSELLRYAPMDERRDRQARRELDRALSGLGADTLPAQAQAIEELRDLLKPRYSVARDRVRKEFPDMRETFENAREDSGAVIKGRIEEYNKAADVYNHAAGAFPASLIRPLFRFPEALPPLKP